MAFLSMRRLGLVSVLMMPALGLWPAAAFSERNPPAASVAPAAALEDPNQARVLVKFRSASALARAAGAGGRAQHAGRLGSRLALPLVDGRPLGPHTQALRGQGLSSRQLAARLAAQADVEWAVVDERRYITAVPNDPYYAAGQTSITPAVGQWYLHKPSSTLVSAINAESAWDLSTGSATVADSTRCVSSGEQASMKDNSSSRRPVSCCDRPAVSIRITSQSARLPHAPAISRGVIATFSGSPMMLA